MKNNFLVLYIVTGLLLFFGILGAIISIANGINNINLDVFLPFLGMAAVGLFLLFIILNDKSREKRYKNRRNKAKLVNKIYVTCEINEKFEGNNSFIRSYLNESKFNSYVPSKYRVNFKHDATLSINLIWTSKEGATIFYTDMDKIEHKVECSIQLIDKLKKNRKRNVLYYQRIECNKDTATYLPKDPEPPIHLVYYAPIKEVASFIRNIDKTLLSLGIK